MPAVNRGTPQTTADLLRNAGKAADHHRTVRKIAGHTAEHSGAGSKTAQQQCRPMCIFRVNVRQISIARRLRPDYIQTLYADDAKLFKHIQTPEGRSSLQNMLNNV